MIVESESHPRRLRAALWLAPGTTEHQLDRARRHNATRPEIKQVHVPRPRKVAPEEDADRDLFTVPPSDREGAPSSNIAELYVCSLSAQSVLC